jgi:glycosyltransferase involved in cell wall biosynthesis
VTEVTPPQGAGKSSSPKITVTMPIYNAGHQLRLAVLSIVAQTFADWQLLIIDDGSTDDALQGISDIQDPRIHILQDGSNKGLAARLNEGIDLARGPYFARMDQDDVSYPERFASQLALLESRPELDVVAVRAISISDENEYLGPRPGPLSHEQICSQPWKGFFFPHPTWMGHTEWFRTHRYASPGPFFCEDQELLLRSYAHSHFATVDEVLFAYRVRQHVNWKKQLKTRRTLFNVQWRYFTRLGPLHYALFSLAAFAGRIGSDILRLAQQSIVRPSAVRTDGAAAEQSRWQQVLEATRKEA